MLGGLLKGVIRIAATPVTLVKDVVDVAKGKEPNTTKDNLSSAIDDIFDF